MRWLAAGLPSHSVLAELTSLFLGALFYAFIRLLSVCLSWATCTVISMFVVEAFCISH